MNSTPVTHCAVCGLGQLQSLVFLGYLPPVNTLTKIGERPTEQPFYPAELLQCPVCKLVQLGCIVDREILFPRNYAYRSSTTKALQDNFADLCREVQELGYGKPGDFVVDVGSNDGSLLQHFKAAGFNVMGVEPTAAAMEAQCKGIPTCPTTLRTDLVRWWLKDLGKPEKAQVITACNVFAHTPDPNGFVATVKEFLADDGVFVVEVQNVFSLEYDTVYHEHLQYYSLESLNRLFHRNEMEIIRYRSIPTHGGSLRVYVTKSTSDKCRVPTLGIPADDFSGKVFGKQVVRQRLELLALIAELKRSGAKIYGVGCPSRGVSLIYFAGLQGVLDCVCEIAGSPKIGHYVPACKIPIVDERFLYEVQPRYALLLSWHLADDLIQKIRAKGFKGQFILPLPNARVV